MKERHTEKEKGMELKRRKKDEIFRKIETNIEIVRKRKGKKRDNVRRRTR